MNEAHNDLANFELFMMQLQAIVKNVYIEASSRKVAHSNIPRNAAEIPNKTGIGLNGALELFQTSVLPFLSASVGPRFLGYITGGTTPAALIADWLVSALDQNVMISGDSMAVAIEHQSIELLKKMFLLDSQEIKGLFTTGATASNILAMAMAREWAGDKLGIDFSVYGVKTENIRIYSATNHASIFKALSMVGLGRNNLISVPTIKHSESIDTNALQKSLIANPGKINIVVSNAGTVNTGSFDSIDEIASLCHEYDAWLHVDAAFGIFTRISKKYEHLSKGLERADSITADVHKWLNVPYDCGLLLTRSTQLLQRVFGNKASYLESNSDTIEPMDVGIENSRRFRALPVWFSIIAYGYDYFRDIVERHCELARTLAERLENSGIFRVYEKPRLNIVCFAPIDSGGKINSDFTNSVMKTANAQGAVFLTPTQLKGQRYIRAAFSNWRTQLSDLDIVVDSLVAAHQRCTSPQSD